MTTATSTEYTAVKAGESCSRFHGGPVFGSKVTVPALLERNGEHHPLDRRPLCAFHVAMLGAVRQCMNNGWSSRDLERSTYEYASNGLAGLDDAEQLATSHGLDISDLLRAIRSGDAEAISCLIPPPHSHD